MKLHVIAEAGINYNSDLEAAKRLAEAAKAAGADSVKYQLTFPAGFMLPETLTSEGYVSNEGFERRQVATLSVAAHRDIARHCETIGIPFSASVFDRQGLDLLDSLNAPYIKISSGDVTHVPLLKEVGERGRKVILSTGMAELGEIETAVEAITGTGNSDLVLMHCISLYPCPPEMMNLDFIDVLNSTFGFPVGFSDHSESNQPAIIAVAKGARWIEKHFTLDRSQPGPDHSYSLEPKALANFVEDLHAAEAACQSQLPKVSEAEALVRARARRGLYAARELPDGTELGEDDVLIVRPEAELRPQDLSLVVGRRTNRALKRYQPISGADVDPL